MMANSSQPVLFSSIEGVGANCGLDGRIVVGGSCPNSCTRRDGGRGGGFDEAQVDDAARRRDAKREDMTKGGRTGEGERIRGTEVITLTQAEIYPFLSFSDLSRRAGRDRREGPTL